jgi:polar amino acid transport system permease protein
MHTLLGYGGFLVEGAWMTIRMVVPSALLACFIALTAGIARTSPLLVIRILPTAYIEIFRGTPCYAQLFWVFFVLPFFGFSIDPITAAVFVFGSNIGSYGSEVVRSAILNVPYGQREAAIALNYTRWQRFRCVTLPQALVIMTPPAGNLLIDLVKLTSLASLITVADLTHNALVLRQQTGDTLISLLAILVGYFLLSSFFAWGTRAVERYGFRWHSLSGGTGS